MALAPYFDKAALAASSVLVGFDHDAFAASLEQQLIVFAFDDAVVDLHEGRTLLAMAINLASRLYPRISIRASGDSATSFAQRLLVTARLINPHIDVASPAESGTDTAIWIVLGNRSATEYGASARAYVIYAGSTGWVALLDRSPVALGATRLPFGAAASACLAFAQVFRHVFATQLPLQDAQCFPIALSTRTGATGTKALDEPDGPDIGNVDVGDVSLIGVGAVGNASLWTLVRTPGLRGQIDAIDGESVDATNPQRYVLTSAADVDREKVLLLHPAADEPESELRTPGNMSVELRVRPHRRSWGQYLSARALPWRLKRVLVAVDSAADRISVTAALPAWVANAWTQAGDLGVSRHRGLGPGACIACHYIPLARAPKNEDQLVAEACGLRGQEMLVRRLLATGTPVDESLLRIMAVGMGVPVDALLPFVGRPLRAFYSEAICGGVVLRLQSKANENGRAGRPHRGGVAPMAFQSALAGVLLAAALVAESASVAAPPDGWKVALDVLGPLTGELLVPVAKHPSQKCLCQDPVIQRVFNERWRRSGNAESVQRVSPLAAGQADASGDALPTELPFSVGSGS